jgi:cytochrome c oxidase subunit II
MLIDRLLGLPVQASAHASELDWITFLVHVLMFALFFGWGSYFIWALIRFRSGRNPQAQYEPVKSRISTYHEAALVIIKLILLVGFSIPAWATRVRDVPPEPQATVVRVVSEQFVWNMHYAGDDGEFGRTDVSLVRPENPVGLDRRAHHAADDVVTMGEMVVPVGRPVIVQLTAKDVIHSFGVPAMRVKQDAIPGMMIPLWFTPTQTGDYEIVCSQLCGLGHYRMRGILRVVTEAEYRAWLAEQAS